MKENQRKWIRYGVCFVLIGALCWLFPYTGDDWAWGSQIGIDRLNGWFADYNGRYVGNLIVLAMTRSNWIKTIVMSFGLTGICMMAEKIFQRKWAFYVSCVALVLMPKMILKQAVVWTAGYSNYVTSLFFVLLYITYVYPVFQKEMPKRKLWHGLPLLVLGACSSLIMEHLTIYNVVLAVGVLVYTLAVHRKVVFAHAAYLIGAVGGAVIMFSNGAYHNIAQNQDGYRQMAEGGVISRAIENYVQQIAKHLCLNNIWVNLAILLGAWLLYRQSASRMNRRGEQTSAVLCLVVMVCFNIWALLSSTGIVTEGKQNRLLYMEALFVMVYMVALIGFSILIGIRQQCLWQILFWNASIVCVAAPLLVVNPIGERCFFATYILFVFLLLEIGSQLREETVVAVLQGTVFCRACFVISLAGLAFYLNIFSSIYQVDHDRLARIRRQVEAGQTSAEIVYLPYESYLWASTPDTDPLAIARYKLFYGLPEDLELKAVKKYSKKKK